MGVPATTGFLRTKIEDMEIGDYIKVDYLRSILDSVINSTSSTECAITGTTSGTAPQCFFYMVKVDRGILISDRVVANTMTWDNINTGKHIQGRPTNLYNVNGIIRSLTGGVANADANGKLTTGNTLGLGAFPINNEWDRFIVNFPTDKIQSGKTLDDVFHWNGIFSWVQETPSIILPSSGNTQRALRGGNFHNRYNYGTSSSSNTVYGFRPVFEYQES